jgi:hypothetical protein
MALQAFSIKEKVKIIADIADIRVHMNVLNGETGELRDIIKEIKTDLTEKATKNADNIASINVKMSQVQNDVDWIKKTYWLVASSAIGALITGVVNLAGIFHL